MVTFQSALNGINRDIQYMVEQTESQTTKYHKTIDNIQEIKNLALQLIDKSDKFLVNYTQININYGIKEVNNSNVNQFIITDSKQFLETLKEYLHVDETNPKEKHVEICPAEPIDIEPTTISIVEDEKHTESPGYTLIKDFNAKFKEVVIQTANFKSYQDEATRECAKICGELFKERFDRTNDPNGIHKFKIENYRDYLISTILTYAIKTDSQEITDFRYEFDDWIERVKDGTMPYTLPKSIADVYFGCIDPKFESKSFKITKGAAGTFITIWNNLWDLNYKKFNMYKDCDFSYLMPSDRLDWIIQTIVDHVEKE